MLGKGRIKHSKNHTHVERGKKYNPIRGEYVKHRSPSEWQTDVCMRTNLHTILFIRENSGATVVIPRCNFFINTLTGQFHPSSIFHGKGVMRGRA